MPYRWFALVLGLGLGLPACLVTSSKESLLDAVNDYNAAVRWGRTETMAEHVPEERRTAVAGRGSVFGELQVTACEVDSVNLKDPDHATARVRVEWYLLSSLRVRISVVEQVWERRGRQWLVVKQRLLQGPPCPLLSKQTAVEQQQLVAAGRN